MNKKETINLINETYNEVFKTKHKEIFDEFGYELTPYIAGDLEVDIFNDVIEDDQDKETAAYCAATSAVEGVIVDHIFNDLEKYITLNDFMYQQAHDVVSDKLDKIIN